MLDFFQHFFEIWKILGFSKIKKRKFFELENSSSKKVWLFFLEKYLTFKKSQNFRKLFSKKSCANFWRKTLLDNQNIARALEENAGRRASHPAIIEGDRTIPYWELDSLVRRIAGHLWAFRKRGERTLVVAERHRADRALLRKGPRRDSPRGWPARPGHAAVRVRVAAVADPGSAVDAIGRTVSVHESMPFAIYVFLANPKSFVDCLYTAALNGGRPGHIGGHGIGRFWCLF